MIFFPEKPHFSAVLPSNSKVKILNNKTKNCDLCSQTKSATVILKWMREITKKTSKSEIQLEWNYWWMEGKKSASLNVQNCCGRNKHKKVLLWFEKNVNLQNSCVQWFRKWTTLNCLQNTQNVSFYNLASKTSCNIFLYLIFEFSRQKSLWSIKVQLCYFWRKKFK